MTSTSPPSIRVGVIVAAIAAAIAVSIPAGLGIAALIPGDISNAAAPAAAVSTSFPGLATPTGEPGLDSIDRARPRPGEVVQAAGPFDDRFVYENLGFDGRAVSGAVRVTSDVSALLELEVVAGFFDDRGTLLGTARYVHHLVDDGSHEGAPEELQAFTIAVPEGFLGTAASVAVGVPVLVNE